VVFTILEPGLCSHSGRSFLQIFGRDDRKRLGWRLQNLAVPILYIWLISYGARVIKGGERHSVDHYDQRDSSLFLARFRVLSANSSVAWFSPRASYSSITIHPFPLLLGLPYRRPTTLTSVAFLKALIRAVPYRNHTVLTDNDIQFADAGKPRRYRCPHPFGQLCRACDIEHRLTRPYQPWTNGQAERMIRALKETP
jgi:hypothetical protein